jgi:hypothetical protein
MIFPFFEAMHHLDAEKIYSFSNRVKYYGILTGVFVVCEKRAALDNKRQMPYS